jgi:hypothetical protein
LSDFPEAVGDRLQVRFSTADSSYDSLTEAAIDEFVVRAIRCSITPGDANDDGSIDRVDFGRLLGCWTGPARRSPGGGCEVLDFDHDFHVDLFDYQAFQIALAGE